MCAARMLEKGKAIVTAYYNEINPKKAAILRRLISDGHIAPGDVDERSIKEVKADDVSGYNQCHWFAGIGMHSVALRLAGWPDDRPADTGSCPCPPWSNAKIWHRERHEENDERDLWPDWWRIEAERRAPRIVGEQVAGKAALRWYDRLADDMEAAGYTLRACITPALSVGSPQRRYRIIFVADLGSQGVEGLEQAGDTGFFGARGWSGEEDLQAIARNPFIETSRWPQPLIRALDDGSAERNDLLHAAGDAIVPQLVAEVIRAAT